MGTTILDTTSSETGTVVEFGSVNRYEPETAVIAIQLSAGDEVTVYGKVGDLPFLPARVYTESIIDVFIGLPEAIRIDRTVDGGAGEAYAAIT